jgi:hypothetical protein
MAESHNSKDESLQPKAEGRRRFSERPNPELKTDGRWPKAENQNPKAEKQKPNIECRMPNIELAGLLVVWLAGWMAG